MFARIRFGLVGVTLAVSTLVGGCAAFSSHNIGPSSDKVTELRKGVSTSEAFMKLGPPDLEYQVGDDIIYVWHRLEGLNVFGLFHQVRKQSLVALFRDQQATDNIKLTDRGRATAILGLSTVSVDELPE